MKKINELKKDPLTTEETLIFLQDLKEKMARERRDWAPALQVLRDDYEAFLKTGKLYEPTDDELKGKTKEEILELLKKNRPAP